MLLDRYEKQLDSLYNITYNIIKDVRRMAMFDREPHNATFVHGKAMEAFTECCLAKKDIVGIKRQLKELVRDLESYEILDEVSSKFLLEKYFSPLEGYGIGLPIAHYDEIINKSFEYQEISTEAFLQMIGEELSDEYDKKSEELSEIINEEYLSYIREMSHIAMMINEKEEPIDILIYLNKVVL